MFLYPGYYAAVNVGRPMTYSNASRYCYLYVADNLLNIGNDLLNKADVGVGWNISTVNDQKSGCVNGNPQLTMLTTTVTDIAVLAGIMVVLDAAFLYASKDIFARQVMRVQGTPLQLHVPSAIVCYVLMVLGLYYFVLTRAREAGWSTTMLVWSAAALGILVYGVYEATTMAVLHDWSVRTAVVDVFWGATLFALSALLWGWIRGQ
jgi:uncharacterized membrane protein